MTTEAKYIAHVEECFAKADRNESKINDEIIAMDGMTGTKTRHLYNNLVSMPGTKYLEIGVWKGSSSCAAMFRNNAYCVFMDNWAAFGGPKEEFLANFNKFKGINNAEFIEADCFNHQEVFGTKFNIYLFDGDHSERSQYLGVELYLPVLEDVFIFIVDDWNCPEVRNGTKGAFAANSLEIVWEKEIRLTEDDSFTKDQDVAKNTWWNGVACFIIKKPK